MKGPRRKPDAVKKLQGSFRPGRGGAESVKWSEALGRPEPPDYIPKKARSRFLDLVECMASVEGLLATVDATMLAELATAIDTVAEMNGIIEAEGYFYGTQSGREIEHPAVKIRREASKVVSTLSAEFGLSPSARAKVAVTGEIQTDDPVSLFLQSQAKPA